LRRSVMIESIMDMGIGFLIAALSGLLFAPLIHNRAVRLTARRLDAATPSSIIEVRADKDQLRAEFALSVRRLETSIERMKTKTAAHLAQISKKTETINALKKDLDEKTVTINALEMRDRALRTQLSATQKQFEASSLRETERAPYDNKAELRKQLAALADKSRLFDEHEFDIKRRRDQLDSAGDIEDDVRSEIVATPSRRSSVSDKMHSKIDRLEALLSAMVEARSK
jgi:chromosome segregation ATPase